MAERPCILFTAFEHSGDEHAAPVIAELRRILPNTPIYALGGRRMAEAGAEMIEQSTATPTMFLDSLKKVSSHRRMMKRLKQWLNQHRVAVHVPIDSPAANWGICAMVKRRWGQSGAKVAHLVAPQVWAWASWRVRRLARWSDMVMCVLPFEPAWFAKRGVRARFVGHPLFNHPLDETELNWQAMNYPGGAPKLVLLPGSRPAELRQNWPVIREVFDRLVQRYPRAQALVPAADDHAANWLRGHEASWPDNLKLVENQTDSAIHWCDAVLAVSGTVSLHVARHGKPMTILYKISPWAWNLVGRWLLRARTFTLPNLIAVGAPEHGNDGHIVREFIPFWGDVQPIVDEMASLLDDERKRNTQLVAMNNIIAMFSNHNAGREAAQIVAQLTE